MMVHVAEAGEARGRVVLRCGLSPAANDAALRVAIHLARAYRSELEGLFIEDREVFAFAGYPFAREVAQADGSLRPLDAGDLQRQYRALYEAESRHILAGAAAAGVVARMQSVRDDGMTALARCCAALGPWNVVVLAESGTGPAAGSIGHVLDAVQDATGVVAVPRKVRVPSGPVVVAAEDEDRLPVMLRTAERLASVTGSPIRLLLIASAQDELPWLEAQARLLVAGQKHCDIELYDTSRAPVSALPEHIRKQQGGFLITRHGGLVLPYDFYEPLPAILGFPVFSIR